MSALTLIIITLVALSILQGIPLMLVFMLFYFEGDRENRRKRNAMVRHLIVLYVRNRLGR